MSLATRCTACGTVFRVVQDQLKVSEGWVRCGRCSEVFNALEGLFDLERAPSELPEDAGADDPPSPLSLPAPAPHAGPADAAPPPWAEPPVPASDAAPSTPSQAPFGNSPTSTVPRAPADAYDDGLGLLDEPRHAHADEPPADIQLEGLDAYPDSALPFEEHVSSGFDDAPRPAWQDPAPARRTERWRDDPEEPAPPSASTALTVRAPPSSRFADESADETPFPTTGAADSSLPMLEPSEPHFIRHAQRMARWQSPKMVALQGVAIGVLLLILGLQAMHHFRDQLAGRWPALSPPLSAWCGLAGCKIEPPRRIDDLTVESTALARVPGPDNFKLSVVLRNRGAATVLLPWVDLSLTDSTGQQIARRVLSPADFHASAASLKPGAESPLQLQLQAGGANRVTGYTVEIFYP